MKLFYLIKDKMQSKVRVYCYHWEIRPSPINTNKKDIIYAWCLDSESNPYLLRFEGETPFFYLQLPEEINNNKIEWSRSAWRLLSRIKWGLGKSKDPLVGDFCNPTSYDLIYRQLLFFYKGDKKNPLLKLHFSNTGQMYKVARLFYNLVGIPGLNLTGDRSRYETLETSIDIIKRMLARVDCGYCQWFEVDVKVPNIKQSTLNREYIGLGTIRPIVFEDSKKWGGDPGILTYDIECITDNEHMPDANLIGHKIVSISTTYKRCGETEFRIVNFLLGDADIPEGQELKCYYTEEKLLEGFYDYIAEIDPEIITGYNIYGFDNPYLWTRTDLLNVKVNPKASRILVQQPWYKESTWASKGSGNRIINQIVYGGRIDIDTISHVKANYKLQFYTLDSAGKAILGKGKYDLPYQEMFDIYRDYYKYRYQKENYANLNDIISEREITRLYNKAKVGINRAVEYCATDSIITHEIFDKTGIFQANRELCNVVKINVQDVLNRGQQMRGLSIIYSYCSKLAIILNKVKYHTDIEFVGGYVFFPIVGMHDDAICIDFSSLYPSIIVALNLCFTTLLRKEDWNKVNIKDCNVVTWKEDKSGIDREYRFVKPHIRKGILPTVLSELLLNRYKIKGQMKIETNDIVKAILDKKQLALKITANSIYGLTGVTYNMGKLPLKIISAATTASGRLYIKQAAEYVEKKYKGTVIYGDTDSIMFNIPGITGGKACITAGHAIAAEISKIYPNPIKFEFEKAGRILCITKKKYMYWKYDDWKGTKDKPNLNYGEFKKLGSSGSMELRGNILVRRDNCEWYKKIYRSLMNFILEEKSPESAFKNLYTEANLLLSGKVPIKDLILTTKMGLEYKNKSYKTAVFKVALRERGRYISPGDRFGYVVVIDPSKYLGDKMRLIEEFNDNPGKWKIDYYYYFDLISRKNIDQLWHAGYAKRLNKIADSIEGTLYRDIVTGVESFIGTKLSRYLDADHPYYNANSNKENYRIIFEDVNSVYKISAKYKLAELFKRDIEPEEWKMKKELDKQRKLILSGRDLVELNIRKIAKTMFMAFKKVNGIKRMKLIIKDIKDSFLLFN